MAGRSFNRPHQFRAIVSRLAADGSSKLVDFGIAAGRGDTPGVAGTPAYMAPEQWNGEPASPAADVYAATATFYECLTGRKPYTGDNFAELALQHISAPVPEEQAPDPVRPLIRRGLAKAPQERPENAAAFVAELEEIANAAYGPHWEERGQRKLAALAALLPLLLPSPTGQAAGTTELATTALGGAEGRGWTPSLPGALAGAAALILAVVAAVAAAGPSAETPHRTTARTVATTSALPHPATGAPHGPTASASRSPAASTTAVPSPSPPGSPSGPPSESTAAIPAGPSPAMSPTAADPPDPSATSASPSPSAPAPTPTASVRVKSLSITGLRQTSPTGATVTLAVTTDGTDPVTLDVVWFAGDTKGEPGPQDSSQTLRRSGATQYTITLDHAFRTGGCYWTVHATTHPAAANGSSSQQILTRRCSVQ
ncbi:serine/threonine protein kinase [Streptomyces sp. NBC_01142]|uniref:serine/threonine-protein kinase n=1 Tax=Streptomyces sp. NBC_01142 TaxID=2975865 RepID=UPI0022580262|nr:serine/threonine protein kinase [Streptomyces sp. NBC_01142]MCX4825615.1 serine/threonine protein kinase [Streptomyces sp. NBC_01142]